MPVAFPLKNTTDILQKNMLVCRMDMLYPCLLYTSTIRQVGEWLLNEALAQAALWRMENLDFVISVNVSYIQILQEGFREMVTRIVEESGTPEKQLILELTELLSDGSRAFAFFALASSCVGAG